MKKIPRGICLLFVVFFLMLSGCRGRSVIDDVKLENVQKMSYQSKKDEENGTEEAGFYVVGNITNTTNETLSNVNIIVRYYKIANASLRFKKEYMVEEIVDKINSNDTETFIVRVDYEELSVTVSELYDWEIYDVTIREIYDIATE